MGYGYRYDPPPTKCSKGPRPGTVALSTAVMERFGCGTQGIFNCRFVRVTNNGKQVEVYSFHADGRAWDAHCSGDLNREVAEFLVEHADELGIQEVISQRRQWDSRTQQWARYGGDDDHTGHVHTTQCLPAANELTLPEARRICAAPAPDPLEDGMEIIHVRNGPDQGNWFLLVGTKTRMFQGKEQESLTDLQNAAVPVREVGAATWTIIQGMAPRVG